MTPKDWHGRWKQRYARPCRKHPRSASTNCLQCLRRGWWLIWRTGQPNYKWKLAKP